MKLNFLLYKNMKILNISSIPSPHAFASLPLQSTMGEFTEIISKVNELLPQLSDFISQFHNTILTNNINVITDVSGNMSIDVPGTMSDMDAEKISKKLNILDRLISVRTLEINNLLQDGLVLESNFKKDNVNYTSQILDKVKELEKLTASYKH